MIVLSSPPVHVIHRAEIVAAQVQVGRCEKSHRGAVVFAPVTGQILGTGYNSQPYPMRCTGSPTCRRYCATLCEHAEARAIRCAVSAISRSGLGFSAGFVHLVHVKVGDDGLVPSGPPSCVQCSRLILDTPNIETVWLYERRNEVDAWFGYDPLTFHRQSLSNNQIEP